MPKAKTPWFRIREDLPSGAASALTVLSFLIPLGAWVAVSYLPFLWHPDRKLQIAADRDGVTTVYTAGDRLGADFFPEFQAAVREENSVLRAAREAGSVGADAANRRRNQRLLRHLGPVAVGNGWITWDQRDDDAAIFDVWGRLANGELIARSPSVSDENLAIIKENWNLLKGMGDKFGFAALPDVPLLKLVPQAVPANPVFLPAPHEVVQTGWRDFTRPPEGDRPWMWQRLAHSIRIVFSGFLLSCAIGIPLGILCGTYSVFSRLFEPFIDFFRYMPAPVFSTLLVAIFLANDAPKIALIFIGTFFQMVLVVSKTTRQLDRNLLEAAQTLGARPHQLLVSVVIPGVMPNLYNDLRILLGWSWTWLVIAELIGVKSGITEFIETQGRWRNFDSVYPAILMIGLIGFATDQFLAKFRGVLFPHTRENAAGPPDRGVGALFSKVLRKPAIAGAAPKS